MIRTAIKLGAFVAVCTALTLGLAAIIGNTSVAGLFGRGEDTYRLEARFDDVAGLLVDDDVKIAGVPVGKVTGIEVDGDGARVAMEVDADRRLPVDTAAAIRWRNLIGQRYVYLQPGDAPTALGDGDTVRETSSVVDLGELFDRLGPIIAVVDEAQVNSLLTSINTALEGNEADLSRALDDLAAVVRSVGERDEVIAGLIEDVEVVSRTIADREAQIQTMLTNLADLAQTFGDNTALVDAAITEVGSLNRDLASVLGTNRAEVDGIIDKLDRTLGTVEGELDTVGGVLDRLDETTAGIIATTGDGEFLNQAILCLSVMPPPCPTPIVPGLDEVAGLGSAGAVPFHGDRVRGAQAVLSLVGGVRP